MTMSVTPRKLILALTFLSAGCSGWPRHAHMPSSESDAISTDDDPAKAIQIDWIESSEESEPNNQPGRPMAMALGEGMEIEGVLMGLGWTVGAVPDQWSECGDPLAFPPDSPGDYSSDVDWVVVETLDAATLCASVKIEDKDLSFDLTLYVLDDCGEPTEIFVRDGGPIGVGRTGGRWSGAVTVPANIQVGIALASYSPNNADAEVPWQLVTALVPPLTNIDLCPEGQ